MLDEKRVKLMTKIALSDKKDHRDLEIAEEYTARDYVSMRLLQSFVIDTLLYLVLFAAVSIFVFYRYITTIHASTLLMAIFLGLVFYVLFLFVLMRASGHQARKTYDRAKTKRASFDKLMNELRDLYDEDEEQESPRSEI
ncbi:MAG: hypothetical protein PUE94_06265 [Lachnospiraceae bacterium]|nr:hypothetical protein [Lachnospiraceae bacterium]